MNIGAKNESSHNHSLVLVCNHCVNGQATDWYGIPDGDNEFFDSLCPDCLAKYPILAVDEVEMVCVECVRHKQQRTNTALHYPQRDEREEGCWHYGD